jgi:hypothetical protein
MTETTPSQLEYIIAIDEERIKRRLQCGKDAGLYRMWD